jgi:hypothetical protein
VNELSLTLQDALQANNLVGISLGPNCPLIHSLMYADDLIVCGKENVQEAGIIFNLIDHFCQESGETPNWSKSGILFSKNVPLRVKQDIKRFFPVPNIDKSFLHLGHPLVLPSKDRSAAYNFIYGKFKSKLSACQINSYKICFLFYTCLLHVQHSIFQKIPR